MEKFKDIFLFAQKSKIKAGEGLDKGRFPFYTSSAIQNKWIDTEQHFDEALIFGTGGSASIHYESQPFSTSTDCFVTITTRKDVNTKYVYYFLSSNIHLLERGFKGAGLKHLSKAFLEEIEIPLPDVETQNKIVAILDKAKAILDKREETIKKYDELLRATFLEMFGDPVLNPMGWEKVNLENLVAEDCPVTYGIVQPGDEIESGTPVVRPVDLTTKFISVKGLKKIDPKISEQFKRTILKGDELLLSVRGTTGTISIATKELEGSNVTRGITPLRFNQRLERLFAYELLRSIPIQNRIQELTYGAALKQINLSDLRQIPLINPNKDLQLKFEKIAQQVTSIQINLETSKMDFLRLFSSISQLAFKGELDFNTAVDLEVLLENNYQFFKENSNSGSIKLLIERLNTDELNENRFYEQQTYDKAKSFVFELIKEGKVKQVFDEKTKKVKLTV